MQELAQKLNDLCDAQPFTTTWYVKDLRTGQEADRGGDEIMNSASTRKISIMMAALKAVNEGRLSLDDPFVIEEKYQQAALNQTGGCFQHMRPGFTVQLYDAIVMMIIVSDNTCTGKIVDLLGLDEINEFCRSIGMRGTTHRFNVPVLHNRTPANEIPVDATNTTTAADVGGLLDLIIRGTNDEEAASTLGCTPELCQIAVKIMSQQRMTAKIPALLPSQASVAHKTGTGQTMANDAGIVFENGEPRFVLAVYVDGAPREKRDGPSGQTAAKRHVATLSRACWDALVAS